MCAAPEEVRCVNRDAVSALSMLAECVCIGSCTDRADVEAGLESNALVVENAREKLED